MISSAHNIIGQNKLYPVWQQSLPDRKVHGANMGPIWGRQDPGGPQVGPMNFAILDKTLTGRWFQCNALSHDVKPSSYNNVAKGYIKILNRADMEP